MTEEIWRPIEGYEGLYEVSSYGRVKSVDRYVKSKSNSYRLIKGKVLSGSITKYGYVRCNIKVNGVLKGYFVHRLVAEAFIPNPDNLPQVNHKNEVKSDNCVDNLEWCDPKYNMNYGSRQERYRNTMLERGHWSGLSEEQYMKKYKEENKERMMKYFQDYREKHKEKIREYGHQYYQENKEKKKEYYEKNKEKIREYHHQYYLKRKAGL